MWGFSGISAAAIKGGDRFTRHSFILGCVGIDFGLKRSIVDYIIHKYHTIFDTSKEIGKYILSPYSYPTI